MDATITEFTLPSEWDQDHEMINDDDFSAATEEASKVFEQWQTDVEDLDIMEVDEQIGSNLLGDDIFHDPCVSPSGPLEELNLMIFDDDDVDRFSLSLLEDGDKTSSLPFEERYKATLAKLAESMKRSQETRMSLKMKTSKTEKYERTKSISGVLTSIEKSTQQLQGYLKNIRQP
jgi:hypothetical protein